MNKEINVAFLDKKLETDIKIPLVRGDKNAYKLIMDLGKYPDCKYVFIYAERADGETVYDSFEASGKREEYILKQSVYSVLGDVSVRVVLKDNADSVLTASILKFNVIDGAYSENMAEDMESLENVLLVAEKKADKAETLSGYGIKDAYTKTEVDSKFGGVYKVCGSAEIVGNEVQVSTKTAGDVYNITSDGEIYNGGNISASVEPGGFMYEEKTLYILPSDYDDYFTHLPEGESATNQSLVQLFNKTKNTESIMLHGVYNVSINREFIKLSWTNDNGLTDNDELTDEYEIRYIEWALPLKTGDNIVWTGNYWDKLSSTVDVSRFATKDEIPKGYELIDSDTLTQDVVSIVPTVNGKYKELFLVLNMPTTNADNSSTETCRISLENNINKLFFHMPDAFITNYNVPWCAIFNVKMIEKYAQTSLWHMKKSWVDGGYSAPPETSTYNGSTALKLLDNNYIDYLRIKIYSPNNGRVFPAGTTYELWGVKV